MPYVPELSTHFYVYLFLDPRDFYSPFYVGKGKKDRANHLSPTRNNKFTGNVIVAIRAAGFEPIIIKWAENLTESDAFDIERSLISRWGRRGVDQDGILTNRTLGGEGLSGMHFSDEHRAKIGKAHKGRVMSEESRQKLSQSRMGMKLSDEHREKLSAAHRGKGRGKDNPMYGKCGSLHPNYGGVGNLAEKNGMYGQKHSPEAIAKMSEAAKRRPAPKGNQSARGDKTIYDFVHRDERTFTGTIFDLAEKQDLCPKQLYNLVRGSQKTCKGWGVVRSPHDHVHSG